jgi:hypothetical protein
MRVTPHAFKARTKTAPPVILLTATVNFLLFG